MGNRKFPVRAILYAPIIVCWFILTAFLQLNTNVYLFSFMISVIRHGDHSPTRRIGGVNSPTPRQKSDHSPNSASDRFAMSWAISDDSPSFSNFRWKKRPLAENLEVKIIEFLFGINVFYNRTFITWLLIIIFLLFFAHFNLLFTPGLLWYSLSWDQITLSNDPNPKS